MKRLVPQTTLTPGSRISDLPDCAEKPEGSRLGMISNRRGSNFVDKTEKARKLKTTKISSGGDTGESAKVCTSENFHNMHVTFIHNVNVANFYPQYAYGMDYG